MGLIKQVKWQKASMMTENTDNNETSAKEYLKEKHRLSNNQLKWALQWYL